VSPLAKTAQTRESSLPESSDSSKKPKPAKEAPAPPATPAPTKALVAKQTKVTAKSSGKAAGKGSSKKASKSSSKSARTTPPANQEPREVTQISTPPPRVASAPSPPQVASRPAPPVSHAHGRRDQNQGFPDRRRDELTMHPRKVRHGVKLSQRDGTLPQHWATQRWMRILEETCEGVTMVEAAEYAKIGQTRRLDIGGGFFEGPIQGRRRFSYNTRVELDVFTHAQWDAIVEAMSDQALYTAKMLSGELPQNVEDLFAPFGLHLFPTEPAHLRPSCTCGHETPWCKHVMCLGMLIADQLSSDPFLVFTLRGMPGEELVERLRQRRQAATSGGSGAPAPVYAAHMGTETVPLDACLDHYWEAGSELDEVDAPISPPEVSHPLLRRLGPSPFESSRFPFVGLLATCYDVISQAALLEDEEAPELDEAPEPPPQAPSNPLPFCRGRTLGKAKAIDRDN